MLEVDKVSMQFVRRPKPPTVSIGASIPGVGPYASFEADAFEIEGIVSLRGRAAGARLGWTQIQTLDVNRAHFRGLTRDAGRIEMLRDESKAAISSMCRDVSVSSDVFTCPAGTRRGLGYTPRGPMNIDLTPMRTPGILRVSHADKPGEGYIATQRNDRTRQPNYLSWALIEMQFCAVLLMKQQDGALVQLGHFTWGLRWEDRFEPIVHGSSFAGIRRTTGDEGNKVSFQPFVVGPVDDARLARLISAPNAQTCNERAYLRNNHPVLRQHSTW